MPPKPVGARHGVIPARSSMRSAPTRQPRRTPSPSDAKPRPSLPSRSDLSVMPPRPRLTKNCQRDRGFTYHSGPTRNAVSPTSPKRAASPGVLHAGAVEVPGHTVGEVPRETASQEQIQVGVVVAPDELLIAQAHSREDAELAGALVLGGRACGRRAENTEHEEHGSASTK